MYKLFSFFSEKMIIANVTDVLIKKWFEITANTKVNRNSFLYVQYLIYRQPSSTLDPSGADPFHFDTDPDQYTRVRFVETWIRIRPKIGKQKLF